MADPAETWRPVVGYEGHYEVSDLGRVRSIKREPRVLRPSHAGRGYPTVFLCIGGRPRTRYVHHLVAEAFIGPRPDGLDICHGNGDIRDPRVVNLRYDTRHANMRDSIKHGTHHSLTRTHCARGHEMTPANTHRYEYRSADGGTKYRHRCKTCLRAKSRHDYEIRESRHAAAA